MHNTSGKPYSGEGCIAGLTLFIAFFIVMPVVGPIWILLKGWDNTPEWVKAAWVWSTLILVGIGLYYFSGGIDALKFRKAFDIGEDMEIQMLNYSLSEKPTISLRVINNGKKIAQNIDIDGSFLAYVTDLESEQTPIWGNELEWHLSCPLDNSRKCTTINVNAHSSVDIEYLIDSYTNDLSEVTSKKRQVHNSNRSNLSNPKQNKQCMDQ